MTAEPITASVHIDAPPERVYEYFTRPEAILTWMGEYALLEPQPGGRFHLDIKGAPVRGRYLHLDPPHRLLISWGYAGSAHLPPGASTVEVTLTADRGGTRVELKHHDLPHAEQPKHASGWTHYLTRLHTAAPGRDPGPDPGMPGGCPADPPHSGSGLGNQPDPVASPHDIVTAWLCSLSVPRPVRWPSLCPRLNQRHACDLEEHHLLDLVACQPSSSGHVRARLTAAASGVIRLIGCSIPARRRSDTTAAC